MKRIAWFVALAALVAFCPQGSAGESKGYGCYEVTSKPDGSWTAKESSISPDDLAKEVGAAVAGAGGVMTVTGACYSGIYTGAFKNHVGGNGAHLGPSNSNEKTKGVWIRKAKKAWGYVSELVDAFGEGTDTTVDDAHDKAKENDPHNPDGKHKKDVEKKKKRYENWRNKQKKKDKVPPADEAVPEHPQKETTGNGGKMKLKNGTKSNHALIVIGQPGRGSQSYADAWEKLLKERGFDSIETLNNLKGDPIPDGHGGTLPNPGWATKGNITRAIQNLKNLANKDEHFVLIFLGHTVRATQSTATQNNQGAGNGANFSQASNTDNIGLTDNFTNDLLEETSVIDSPAMYRMYQPFFYMRTVTENMTNPTVGISLNGNLLTNLTLENDLMGGYYTVPLPDAFLENTLTDIGATTLNLSFSFANPADSFQLATADDLIGQVEPGSLYGIGIGTIAHGDPVQLGAIPEPAFAGPLGLALAALLRRRRR